MSYSNQLPTRITREIRQHINQSIGDYDYERLQNNYGCIRIGLHTAVFNECYYIIGTYQCKQWLRDCVFEAQAMVTEYHTDNFGELTQTSILHDPERLANMVAYIIGEELINDMHEDDFNSMTNYPEEESEEESEEEPEEEEA